MKSEELINEYESKSGKKAVIDGEETIGFKRWKQQQSSDPKLEETIPRFRKEFEKDINNIIAIYLKKANINPTQKNTIKYLKNYIQSAFPTKVIYETDSDEILDLSNLGIKNLQSVKGLFKSQSLKSLNLNDNILETIPKEIGVLTNLETLTMRNNEISEIPKEIGNLTNLKELNLRTNHISIIPKEIGNLNNLEEFYMNENNISEIPKEIGNLTNLKWLKLEYNNISELPKEIGNLNNLRVLVINGNYISTIPREIGNLNNLAIYMKDNNITKNDIPDNLLNNKYIELHF